MMKLFVEVIDLVIQNRLSVLANYLLSSRKNKTKSDVKNEGHLVLLQST